jgi:hypothetical protein
MGAVAVLAVLILAGSGAGEEPAALDDAARRAVVDTVAARIEMLFVFPEIGAEMAGSIREQLEEGEYDDIDRLDDLVRRLNSDLLSVYPDGHLEVGVLRERPPARSGDEYDRWKQYVEEARYRNFGFNDAKRLEGNIGYLDIGRLYHGSISGETAVAAMSFIGNTDAVIIDLRTNPGGRDDIMQILFTYFFDDETHYATSTYRGRETDRQWWTVGYVPGDRMPDTPLYILTSGNTGSAAEQFAYTLQQLERAVVVGDTTAGAAHTTHLHEFPELGIEMHIPDGTTLSPVTGADWEGRGVIPDISVPSEAALEEAHAMVLDELLAAETDDARRFRLEWVKAEVDARSRPIVLTREQMEAYAGSYGPREILVEGDGLFYRREGRPRFRLLPLGDDGFMLEGLDYFRIRFSRDESGRVSALIGVYDDGTEDPSRRTR